MTSPELEGPPTPRQQPQRHPRVLIVHAHAPTRRRLSQLLVRAANAHVLAECGDATAAVTRIRALHPDLVLLAARLPDASGFDVVERVGGGAMPPVVMLADDQEHAARAFDVGAADYVMKPYSAERVLGAVARARVEQRRRELELASSDAGAEAPLRSLLDRLAERAADAPAPRYHDRIAVKAQGHVRIVPIGDVEWFETDGNYLRIHTARANYLLRYTAKRLQQELDPRRFVRIHRRYVVNLDEVVEVEPWLGGDAVVALRSGRKLRLSRNYRDEFSSRMLSDDNGGASGVWEVSRGQSPAP